jgi:hypothetical protein
LPFEQHKSVFVFHGNWLGIWPEYCLELFAGTKLAIKRISGGVNLGLTTAKAKL